MKKVLFLITKSNWGGAQRYVFDLATNLDTMRYEPVVLLGGNGELAHKLNDANIRVISIPALQRDISPIKELKAIWQIAAQIKAERPAVLHINSSKAGIYGTLLGRLYRVPRIIFTAHAWAFNESRPWWQKATLKLLHWITVLTAHKTITVSEAVRKQLNLPGVKRKMLTVRLGRTVPDFKTRDDARQLIEMRATGTERGLMNFHDDFWIGTIAELHPIKNLNIAIDAVATLIHAYARLRYIIISEGQERAKLEAQIHQLGLEEHVFLVGKLEEAARFLKAFDLFVLPSRSEAAGYVLLEAGLAEIPVVATNVGGIPELITDRQSGLLVPPGNTEALTTALHTLIDSKDERMAYTKTLHMRAADFTIERMVQETSVLY
jgi:glycosyltransferase involved in cell wall biosynthesis